MKYENDIRILNDTECEGCGKPRVQVVSMCYQLDLCADCLRAALAALEAAETVKEGLRGV